MIPGIVALVSLRSLVLASFAAAEMIWSMMASIMASPHECQVGSIALEALLASDNAIFVSAATCVFFIVLSFVASTLSKNYSQVDKLWSITPVVYAWIVATDARTTLMAAVATVWSLRLTYNFYRRGGYTWPPWRGDEDYRWGYIQSGSFLPILTNPIVWQIFNLLFISVYQNVLLWLIASPSIAAYAIATSSTCQAVPLHVGDWIAAGLVLIFAVIESVADDQQYKFQTKKYQLRNEGHNLTGYYADGFCQQGLFSIVRKPNYAAEQAIWISYYIFSVAATGQWFNETAIGWILLVALFQGSGWLTEKISLEKYPVYAEYQKRVPLYVPNLLLTSVKRFAKKKQ